MTRLLIAEADTAFASGIQRVLERRGFAVESVSDGLLALNRIQLSLADVCLLGADLQIVDGLTVLRRARVLGVTMPVMVMAPADTAAARMTWFDAGADDIVGRPFDIDEVIARLRALNRRSDDRALPQHMSCGPLQFDVLSSSFFLEGSLFPVTPKEHAFLRALIARPGFMVPKDRVFRAVFGDSAGAGAIDVLACRVRKKLTGRGVAVNTVRGMGYVIEAGPSTQSESTDPLVQKYTRKATSAPLPFLSVATAPDAT